MKNKDLPTKFFLICFVLFSIIPITSLLANTTATKPTPIVTAKPSSTAEANPDSVRNIENIIKSKTPIYISNPIIAIVDGVENARLTAGKIVENKSILLKEETTISDSSKKESKFIKYFKHVELFFVSLLSKILNTKWLFYTVFIIGSLLAIRYIWWFFLG